MNFLFQNFAKADHSDKACFCRGMGKFYEMLASVEALLCQDDQLLFGSGSVTLNDEIPREVLGMQEEEILMTKCPGKRDVPHYTIMHGDTNVSSLFSYHTDDDWDP